MVLTIEGQSKASAAHGNERMKLTYLIYLFVFCLLANLFWDIVSSRKTKIGKSKSDYYLGGYLYDKSISFFRKLLILLVKTILMCLLALSTAYIYSTIS